MGRSSTKTVCFFRALFRKRLLRLLGCKAVVAQLAEAVALPALSAEPTACIRVERLRRSLVGRPPDMALCAVEPKTIAFGHEQFRSRWNACTVDVGIGRLGLRKALYRSR